MTVALLMVDPQNDFCPKGKLAVRGGDEVVPPLNKAIAHARKRGWKILMTLCWHPKDTEHFKKWGEHCVRGTKGAEPHSDLDLDREEVIIITKGESGKDDGYSGFEGRAGNGKSLLEILISLGITELYIGGLATDYCVKATALDARRNHFVTHLLVDACRAVNLTPDDGARAIVEMVKAGVMLTDVDEVRS